MKYRHGAINRTGGQSTLLYACVCARHPDRVGVKQQSWQCALSRWRTWFRTTPSRSFRVEATGSRLDAVRGLEIGENICLTPHSLDQVVAATLSNVLAKARQRWSSSVRSMRQGLYRIVWVDIAGNAVTRGERAPFFFTARHELSRTMRCGAMMNGRRRDTMSITSPVSAAAAA
jgi:hypothetical protein